MISNTKIADLLPNLSIADSQYVGKSIAVIGKLAKEQLPVPNGFALSYFVLHQFFDLTDIRAYYDKCRLDEDNSHLIEVIKKTKLPGIIQKEILKLYAKISGFSDAVVNIKALILDHNSEEIKHKPYIIDHIRGESALIDSIHDIYVNVLSDKNDFIHLFFSGDLKIVLIVQKSVLSEASGLMYTSDIITHDNTKLTIEAFFGLSYEAELEGLQPDYYIYNKTTGEILEKHISTQEFMLVRQQNTNGMIQKVAITHAWQKRQKLDDKHIVVLAKTGIIIEEELQEAQIITWSYEAGKIWINFIESAEKNEFLNTNNIQAKVNEVINENTNLEENNEEKTMLLDLVLNEKTDTDNKTNMKSTTKIQDGREFDKELLLEGVHYAGLEAEGEISFNHETATENNILVLKGDENISSNLKVAGFIIEEESDILAKRLYEYFRVPVITGVPFAHKILKEGEKIAIDGRDGHIYEFVPTLPEFPSKPPLENLYNQNDITEASLDQSINSTIAENSSNIGSQDNIEQSQSSSLARQAIRESLNKSSNTINTNPTTKTEKEQGKYKEKTTLYEDKKITIEKRIQPAYPNLNQNSAYERKDISKLLDLIEEDGDLYQIKDNQTNASIVEGISVEDQIKIWGKSLENIISASKKVTPEVAFNVFEKVVEESNQISQNSKELEFDREEEYIAKHGEQTTQGSIGQETFIPTATKVYIHLIDETLHPNKQNFDGIVFSSTQEPEIMVEILESILEKVNEKEVITICPPYESPALNKFLTEIYRLRKEHKNLSLITPDYRNKKEIIEIKRQMAVSGLKRSSTFKIYANISRMINVFRLSELEEGLIDGVYVDLFRLKMNMLGAEKLSASTKYVEGMKNLVAYIYENLKVNNRTLINISAFANKEKVIDHICRFGFWGIVCESSIANEAKKHISKLEQSHLELPKHISKNRLKLRL